MKTNLYRHFDENGALLYVGISLSAVQRLKQHEKSGWFEEIASVTIESFDTRELALLAEKEAIEQEFPMYNKVHNSVIDESMDEKISEKYFMVFSRDLKSIAPLVNKQTLFLFEMISRMNQNNVVRMTPGAKKQIMQNIGSKSENSLATSNQYLKQLGKCGLISSIGDGDYMVRPLFAGFSNFKSALDKKQERFIKIKYAGESRSIEVC